MNVLQLIADRLTKLAGGQDIDKEAVSLSAILEYASGENRDLRDKQLKEAKKADLFWRGDQHIYWSETARDYKTQQDALKDPSNADVDITLKKVLNIYRANGESIIAAMSAGLPILRFFPENADDPDDILAAKAYSRLAEKIINDNGGKQKLVEALYILYNQDFVASYVTNERSEKFGIIEQEKEEEYETTESFSSCPHCGAELEPEGIFNDFCPECGTEIEEPVTSERPVTQTQTVKVQIPKAKENVHIFGPLNVKIPFHARNQEDIGYILLETDMTIGRAKSLYPEKKDKITVSKSTSVESWARREIEYGGDYDDSDLCEVRRLWVRPWMYSLVDEYDEKDLLEKYPQGCYAVFINQELMETLPEDMDEVWEIHKNPLSSYISSPSMGRPMIDVQEMYNDLINQTLDTARHAVSETFVDPEVLDLDEYKDARKKAGSVFPIKTPDPNLPIDHYFFERKAATLSKEVESFSSRLEQAGQFLVGAIPSIYGGTIQGGSGTAREYELSRMQALQRLSISWQALTLFWAHTIQKAINLYIKNWPYDTTYSVPNGTGYLNIVITRAQLLGKVAKVEPETSEAFPVSWAQKQERLMSLMNMGNENINAAIFDSQNTGQVASLLGFSQFNIPGEDDRDKQLMEINSLLRGEPIEPEEIDDHEIHMETCRRWMISPTGQEAKKSNPQGYQGVYAHFKMHQQVVNMLAQQAAAAQMQPQQGPPPPQGPPQEAPPQ